MVYLVLVCAPPCVILDNGQQWSGGFVFDLHPWPDCLRRHTLNFSRYHPLVSARLARAANARRVCDPALIPGTLYPLPPFALLKHLSIPMVVLRLCRVQYPQNKVRRFQYVRFPYICQLCFLVLPAPEEDTAYTCVICLSLDRWNQNVDAEHQHIRTTCISYRFIRTRLD